MEEDEGEQRPLGGGVLGEGQGLNLPALGTVTQKRRHIWG